jgi:hypothetical protein
LNVRAATIILAVLLVLGSRSASAHEAQDEEPAEEWQVDDGTVIEVALGGTQLVAPASLESDLTEVVATQTSMFLVEWYMHYRWHLAAWFNLPTAPRISFVDGEPVQEFVPPALALGVIWVPLTIPFSKKRHRFELHAGLFTGAVLRIPGGNFFALAAVRAYVLHESDFGVYVGAAAAPRLDTAALLYGIGYRF